MAYGRGKVTGTKKERRITAPPWYAEIEEARIRKVEQDQAAQVARQGQQK